MKFVVWFIVCCISATSWEQTALTGNRNGQWKILKNKEAILLPRSIHEVGNFDSENLTYFAEGGIYGILDEKGEVVHAPEFKSIKQLGSGIYHCFGTDENYIIDFSTEGKIPVICSQVKSIQPEWYIIETAEKRYLLNSSGKKEFDLNVGDSLMNKGFNYVYLVKENSERLLMNPFGDTIQMGESVPVFTTNYLLIRTANVKKVVYGDHEVILPSNSFNIKIFDDEIHFTADGKTTLISSAEGAIIFSAPYDDIQLSEPGIFIVKKGWKTGVISKDGSVICPPIYNYVYNNKTYYSVNNDNGNGIVSKEGKELVPCAYEMITVAPDFFIVYSAIGYQGLISRKKGQVLLNCTFDRILLDGNKIRARFKDKLRIIEIDTNHTIVSEVTLENVLSLGPMGRGNRSAQTDNRLFSLGWFTEETPKFDEQGYNVGLVTKWGLRGANDSILLKARYSQPVVIPQAAFSLVAREKVKFSYGGGKMVELFAFSAVLLSTGKMVLNDPVFSVDTMDRFSRYYSRFMCTNGFGIIRSDNKVALADYMDGDDAELVRFARFQIKDILPAKETDKDAVRFPNMFLNDDPAIYIKYHIDRKHYEFVKFKNAKWNYFDSVGEELFSTPFDFAEPFFRKTAIVQKDGKWGVVSKDSVVIPFNFSEIRRAPEISDTVFLVSSVPAGNRYLDSLAREMTNGITSFKSETGEIAQVLIGRDQKILDGNYKIVSGDNSTQKLIGKNMFYSREKKEFTIYDASGHLLASCEIKPEEILLESYIVAKSKGRYGLIDFYGDTVVPFEFKNITAIGEFIFASNGLNNTLYNRQLKKMMDCKSAEIMVDTTSGNYAVLLNGKCKVYNGEDNSVLAKFKNFTPNYFANDFLIQTKGITAIKNISGEEIILPFAVANIMIMDNHGYLIEDMNQVYHYFTAMWEKIKLAGDLKHARYVGNGFFTATTKNATLLYGNGTEIWFNPGTKVVDKFESGYILIEEVLQSYFIDRDGNLAFNRKFDDAMPFKGNYATISELEGWSIIDVTGQVKTFPSYGKIVPLGSNIFSANKQANFGLLNAHGDEILPVVFQKINFLPGKIIQGIKEGELFYFDHAGRPLSL